VGWRELDGKTLLSRAHGLISAQCEPVCWLDNRGMIVQDAPIERSPEAESKEWRQLPSSDNFIFDELKRHHALSEFQNQEHASVQETRSPKSRRFSGWVLSASLVLVALQFALFLVAISPQEVIENTKTSLRKWQIDLPVAGSVSSQAQSQAKEKAAWWQSWQQTFVPEIFTSKHEAASVETQSKPGSDEVAK
jgi:hypothetical protein